MSQQTTEQEMTGEALIERVFTSTVGLFDLASIYLGQRLGLYAALRDQGPATSDELADRTGTDERYVREWLEQQAVTGLLIADDDGAAARERRYELPPGHADPLVDVDSPLYVAPLGRQALGMLRPLPQLLARSGPRGRPVSGARRGQARGHCRAQPGDVHQQLGTDWLPAIADVHARLQSPGGLADLGCGSGWSSIAIARAYPQAFVDGIDSDSASIAAARENAAAEGLADRVRFVDTDAGDPTLEASTTW